MTMSMSEPFLFMYIGGFLCGALLVQISLLQNSQQSISVNSRPSVVAFGVIFCLLIWPIFLPLVILYFWRLKIKND